MTYIKFTCLNRDYSEWDLYNPNNFNKLNKIDYNINPIINKLFNQDVIEIDENNSFKKIIHSSTREMKMIPGVITFDKMYGKMNDNKYYYKVIPDDKRLPFFLTSYKREKNKFNKKNNKKYVIFTYNDWEKDHPRCKILHTIGDIKNLHNFYEYILYCKSLHASIQYFTKKTNEVLKETSEEQFISNILKKYNLEDRTQWDVITIDPKKSKDYDDGFGIKDIHYQEKECKLLSIYISNVPLWMDIMNLWDSFSNRISTIYLPDRKRPMLPTILSDTLCSLRENVVRFAFTIDIIINENDILDICYCNTAIKVRKNYDYEDKKVKKDRNYIEGKKICKKITKKLNCKMVEVINDSHDLIMFLMVLVNYLTAKKLLEYKCGIFRSIKLDLSANIPNNLPNNIKKFLVMWNSTGGQYLKYENYDTHDLLKLDAYIHITSPIRRLVDLLNILKIQEKFGLIKMTQNSQKFYDYWLSDERIEYINTTMRAIRKVQNNCELLNKCEKEPEILEKYYDGYIFDKIIRNDALYQYSVYIPEIHLLNKCTSRYDYENYSKRKCRIYLFDDEITFKQKILLSIE